jgi:hypothetical protein
VIPLQFNAEKYKTTMDGEDTKSIGMTESSFDLDSLIADVDKKGMINDVRYHITSGEIKQEDDGVLHIKIQ